MNFHLKNQIFLKYLKRNLLLIFINERKLFSNLY